ncbi:MAG: F0F1 ATP synthase subunit A [Dehalococcoidia bacterium]|jgi:F-type H+-transporting ATPase subunit a|nr:F0F1 ATP synthase subunit A [Dehalococcoidia bacterium]
MTKSRLVATMALLALAAAIASFIGGSVGSAIAGREPVSLLAIGPPHLSLPPGRPFLSFPLTNTLLASWLSCAVIIVIFLLAARRGQLVPTGLQNFVEYLCEFASSFIEEMVGKEQERRMFPIVMTVFLFVVVNAWFGLVPGFETLRLNGVPLLRSANTDINVPIMLALVCVGCVEYWGLRSRGRAYLGTFLDYRELSTGLRCLARGRVRDGLVGSFYGLLYMAVGFLELVGHATRIVSFSFRLFGNMTAGVVLTGVALFIVPLVVPTLFYGLEALFGFVQALVFAGLTAVFAYAAVSPPQH